MGARITLKLFEPIKHGSTEIREVSVRRLKAKDIQNLSDSDNLTANDQFELYSKLTGQPMSVILEFDVVDLEAIKEVIQGFSKSGPETGEASSP